MTGGVGAAGSLVARAAAAQATLDRFDGQAFRWGEADCARMAGFHLRGMGWKPNLSRFGTWRSERGARAALARTGFASLEAVLDDLGLVRIAPARALVGDLVGLPGEGGLMAMNVRLTNGRLLGVKDGRFGVLAPNYAAEGGTPVAWSVSAWPRR